jgi:hypothetical protein
MGASRRYNAQLPETMIVVALTTLGREMAKAKRKAGRPATSAGKMGRPATSTRDDVAVKVDRDVVGQAKIVAWDRGISLAEYITETLRAAVGRDFDRVVQARAGKKGGEE